jgi:hypothetical protein
MPLFDSLASDISAFFSPLLNLSVGKIYSKGLIFNLGLERRGAAQMRNRLTVVFFPVIVRDRASPMYNIQYKH